ncbi:uncharacterized protein LOC133191102 [Saccostrea echinata]|uniref:uncharacterized protein LOC133191102 n=1 Tax=Saccostrea echinata TaxID=191078 RepID=UPI002A8088AF|nr:uncharacterized protein LOC133191102 [Saccostrea echinata]
MIVKNKRRIPFYFRMGFGISKQVTINERQKERYRSSAIVFSRVDAEGVLKFELVGTYLLYRDYESDHLYLSVRSSDMVEHHRINFEDNLYYMDNQPYPYLDSIILYHQRHKLNGTKLTHHAPLSARTVKAFTTKVMRHNGNLSQMENDPNVHNIHDKSHYIASIEHTNDDVIKTRISKSSGRLWISGTMQHSLKRISMPIPEVYHHLGDNDSRLKQSYRGSTNFLSKADSFGDLNGDIFDSSVSARKRSDVTDSDCDSVNIDDEDVIHDDENIRNFDDEEDDGVLVYDTHL